MSAQTQAHLSPYPAYHNDPLLAGAPTSSFLQQYQQLQRHPSIPRKLSDTISHSSSPTNAYMNPLPSPPPQTQHTFQSSPHHGIKRSAPLDLEDELERSSHISNQFKKLRLNSANAPTQNPAYTFDAQSTTTASQQQQQQQHQPPHPPPPHPSIRPNDGTSRTDHPPPPLPPNDFMTLDDTPSRVYIPSLDAEVAAIEAAERAASSQLFLPDFEKQIGAIPDHVLRSDLSLSRRDRRGGSGGAEPGSQGGDQALVLYKDPTSISVPQEEDAVRKAILDARRGIRERMRKEQQREREMSNVNVALARGMNGRLGLMPGGFDHMHSSDTGEGNMMESRFDLADDEDAMDIE